MCRIADAERSDFGTNRMVRAKKEHRCTECGRAIAAGEEYEYASGKIDGYFLVHKTCQHCTAARAWLLEACTGYVYTEVGEELIEHWWESETFRSVTLARLIAGMRHRWFDGRMPVPDVDAVRASVPDGVA
jgi:hypothetical protein